MTNPHSLVARIYKARYYPQSNFLSAKIGGSPSYIWRSILEAQQMLKQGMACRLGTGDLISITEDPWLPDVENPFIQTIHPAIQNAKVSSLMVSGENKWDEDLLEDIFDERDINLILSIPLQNNSPDSWYWKYEKCGGYSVKTAYRRIQDSKPGQNSSVNPCFWKNLWTMKVPPKVKHFMWRAATDCLPTKVMLRTKRVEVNILCPLCNSDPESTSHVLLHCSFAKSCWDRISGLPGNNEGDSFSDWVLNNFDSWDVAKRQKNAMLCWSIWKARNELVWNQRGTEIVDVVESANMVLRQWQSAQDKQFDNFLGFMTKEDGEEHWSLPSENKSKVNTDAAIFQSSNCYSFAFVARNHAGDLIEARSSCKQGSMTPESAEAMGIREALSWIKEQHMCDVTIESDCLVAIQAIRSSSLLISYFGRLIAECKNLLSELKNRGVFLKFVKRFANHVAHHLARYSSSIADRRWWMSNAHSEFLHVLKNDLRN